MHDPECNVHMCDENPEFLENVTSLKKIKEENKLIDSPAVNVCRGLGQGRASILQFCMKPKANLSAIRTTTHAVSVGQMRS